MMNNPYPSMDVNPLRIALAQINPTVGALSKNAALILEFSRTARESGADLVVFPELAISGYPPEDLILKDHFVEDCMEEVKRIAAALPTGATFIIGCPWGEDDQGTRQSTPYNAAIVVHDGQIQKVYRKMLLPNYGVFDEKRVFTAGKVPVMIDIVGRRVSVQICEDSWQIDQGPCTELTDASPDLIVNLLASPYYRNKLDERHFILGQVTRHVHCPLLYCNLVGGQDELVFDGASLVLDANGEPMARARQFEEDLLVVELPAGQALPSQRIEPRAKDLREVYTAITLGLRDYVNKNRFKKVIVALSGGVDLALVGILAADALGAERVVGITMPSQYSSIPTIRDARQLAENMGIQLLEVAIEGLFNQYIQELSSHWENRESDTTEENLQARIRGNIIMAFSNKFGWLVLTTGNKSEIAVGYCTLYGDMAGGFAVIKDVPKTLVWELCRWRNQQNDAPFIPPSTIERPPSAELRPDQKDTDSLPPYYILDAILERYVELDFSLDEIVADGFEPAMVQRIIRLVDINEYKRRQAAPGIKITPKAFGRDRRLPITNAYQDK